MVQIPRLKTQQIDGLNIGLMIFSLIIAYFLPFELFLFSYAVLGPLHYLTEISWLHKKKYFVPTKTKTFLFFGIAAIVLALIISWPAISKDILGQQAQYTVANWGSNIIFTIFALAFILVVLKKQWQRIVAVVMLMIINLSINLETNFCYEMTDVRTGVTDQICNVSNDEIRAFQQAFVNENNITSQEQVKQNQYNPYQSTLFFFSAYLPTLVHVYIFTMLFMLFGSLKSGSRLGMAAIIVLIICGIMPFIFQAPFIDYQISEYAKKSYGVSFLSLNQIVFDTFNLGPANPQNIYTSSIGIALTRFIAFAYTYHYLNWFSKTSIIQWHKMRSINLIVVLLLWTASIVLYAYSYKIGLAALFFLSFLHVFMEFPLNFQSIIGIGRSVATKFKARPA